MNQLDNVLLTTATIQNSIIDNSIITNLSSIQIYSHTIISIDDETFMGSDLLELLNFKNKIKELYPEIILS